MYELVSVLADGIGQDTSINHTDVHLLDPVNVSLAMFVTSAQISEFLHYIQGI